MQDPRSHTCCFSGYRPGKMPFNVYDPAAVRALEILLDRAIDRAVAKGYDNFWSGMALGFDIWAAEAVIRAKKRHNVRLLCAIPHEHQSDRYPPDWKKRYNVCLVHSDGVHIFAPQYFTGCFAVRNRFMVDASSLLLCYYDGRSGGTAQTVFYAEKQHVRTVNLAKSAFSLR